MSKNHYYGRNKDRSDSINFENPVDLDDVNEVTVEEEAAPTEAPIIIEEPEMKDTKKDEPTIGVVNTLSNMRKAPDIGSEILTIIKEDTKVKILDQALVVNEFYHIKFNGLDGYILSSLCDLEGV